MAYVVAGYTIVLTILFLYGLSLAWRRRRLTQAAQRVASLAPVAAPNPSASPTSPVPVAAPAVVAPATPSSGPGGERLRA